MRTTIGMLLAALAMAACSDGTGEPGFRDGNRVLRQVTDTVALVGGGEQDTVLFMPTMVEFVGAGIAVWDRDRSQILFFSREGEPRWSYGRKGAGPGEFAGVTQIAADDRSQLWVLDPHNARVTLLDERGALVRAFPLPDVGYVDRLVPLGRGRALAMGLDPMVHVIDDHGNLVGSRPHPYGAYATLDPLGAYNRPVHDWKSDSTAFFFYYGGGFARTDASLAAVPVLDGYVEDIPFPGVSTQQSEGADGSVTTTSQVMARRLAAKGGSADDGVLNLLFQGDSEYGNRLIDRYSIGSGQYIGSWLLPDSARAIDVSGDLVAAIVETPYPALVIRRAPRS